MKNVIPRKSASLILVRPFQAQAPFNYNYKILLLKRTSSSSFSNMFAFPGGLYDQEKDLRTGDTLESLRNTACRETLEETGLFLLNPRHDLLSREKDLLEIREEFKQKGLEWYSFNHLSARLPYADQSLVRPFLRLITIPFLKYRYDTQFFLHRINEGQTFNWRNFFTGSPLESCFSQWNQINFDQKEFSELTWLDPLSAIQQYYESGFGLAPPQFILLNIMSNFKEIENLEAFLSKSSQNTFPFMLCMRNIEDIEVRKGYKYVALGNCDDKYPIEQVLGKEKDEALKQELKRSYFESAGQGNRVRIFFKEMQKMFEKDYDVDIKLNSDSLMSFLCGYKEIYKRYNQK